MPVIQKQSYVWRSFQAYFNSSVRVTFELGEIVELLKIEAKPYEMLNGVYKQCNHKKAIEMFKWLILANKLIMEFVIEPGEMAGIVQGFQCTEEDEFDQLLNNKLIKPYKLYLMKRCQFLPKKSQQLDRMYQLMNLIQAGTGFCDIIYTLGRYYAKAYPFAADFNVVLGADLTTVYNQMVKYTPKPAPSEILFQYEKIHEKMYIVYYNCYYYKCLKPFVPRWVVTDLPEEKAKVRTPSTQESLKGSMMGRSIVNGGKGVKSEKIIGNKSEVYLVSEFDLAKSEVFCLQQSKSKQFEQSLMLLKSMQRVFEELDQV